MFSDVMMSLQVSGVVTMQPHDSAQLSQVALGLTEQETSQLDGNSFIFLLFDNLDGRSQLREGSRADMRQMWTQKVQGQTAPVRVEAENMLSYGEESQ